MAVARKHIVVLCLASAAGPFLEMRSAGAAGDGQGAGTQVPAARMPVHEAKRGKVKIDIEARGSIEAVRVAPLYCTVEGQTTIISLVPEGRVVKQGDLVCQLDSSALRDRLTNQEISEQRRRCLPQCEALT